MNGIVTGIDTSATNFGDKKVSNLGTGSSRD